MKKLITLALLTSSLSLYGQIDLSEKIEITRGAFFALLITQKLNYELPTHGFPGSRYWATYSEDQDKIIVGVGPEEVNDYDRAKKELERVKNNLVSANLDMSKVIVSVRFRQNRTLVLENGKYFEK